MDVKQNCKFKNDNKNSVSSNLINASIKMGTKYIIIPLPQHHLKLKLQFGYYKSKKTYCSFSNHDKKRRPTTGGHECDDAFAQFVHVSFQNLIDLSVPQVTNADSTGE